MVTSLMPCEIQTSRTISFTFYTVCSNRTLHGYRKNLEFLAFGEREAILCKWQGLNKLHGATCLGLALQSSLPRSGFSKNSPYISRDCGRDAGLRGQLPILTLYTAASGGREPYYMADCRRHITILQLPAKLSLRSFANILLGRQRRPT